MDKEKGYKDSGSHRQDRHGRLGTRRGFTVMEILVVIAVVGILAAIGFYSLNTLRPVMAIRGVSTEINTMLHKARMDAIRNSRIVVGRVVTELGAAPTPHNTTGIKNEYLVFSVLDDYRNETELNSYRMFRGFPNIHFWAHDEVEILTGGAVDFASGQVVFNSDGTVFETGAFRIGYAKTPVRNTLEIRLATSAGIPEVRKYLLPGDRPTGAPAQEFFAETAATSAGAEALWKWY